MKFTKNKHFKKHNNPYNWEQGCNKCGGKFTEDEEFTRVDVQTSIFRGDDEVYCFHNTCNWNEKDFQPLKEGIEL